MPRSPSLTIRPWSSSSTTCGAPSKKVQQALGLDGLGSHSGTALRLGVGPSLPNSLGAAPRTPEALGCASLLRRWLKSLCRADPAGLALCWHGGDHDQARPRPPAARAGPHQPPLHRCPGDPTQGDASMALFARFARKTSIRDLVSMLA